MSSSVRAGRVRGRRRHLLRHPSGSRLTGDRMSGGVASLTSGYWLGPRRGHAASAIRLNRQGFDKRRARRLRTKRLILVCHQPVRASVRARINLDLAVLGASTPFSPTPAGRFANSRRRSRRRHQTTRRRSLQHRLGNDPFAVRQTRFDVPLRCASVFMDQVFQHDPKLVRFVRVIGR